MCFPVIIKIIKVKGINELEVEIVKGILKEGTILFKSMKNNENI